MSKIGKTPITLLDGVTIDIKEDGVVVKGKNATLTVPLLKNIEVTLDGDKVVFTPKGKGKQVASNWGTMRSLVNNAILGASRDFIKKLIVEGVGYKANVEGDNLILKLGYSHPIKMQIPEGIKIQAEKNRITVAGPNKEKVGKIAAEIREFKKPEPYKGKGIRYEDEIIRRKSGKRAIGATA